MVTKDELRIKIIDFGSCKDMEGTEFEKKFEEERKSQKSLRPSYKNFVGTPNYMAPECVRNKNSDFASDCWSLGCLLYNLFTGFPPFLGKSDYLIFVKSTEASFGYPKDVVPLLAQDLINKLIVVDPTKRLTLEEIFEHPFLKNDRENLQFPRYPYFGLFECCYKGILMKLKKQNMHFKNISEKIEKIKNIENMIEDCKRNEIKQDLPIEDSNLLEKKESLMLEYQEGYDKMVIEINSMINVLKSVDSENSEKLINKIMQMERQLKHEFFKIDYSC